MRPRARRDIDHAVDFYAAAGNVYNRHPRRVRRVMDRVGEDSGIDLWRSDRRSGNGQ